MTKYVKYDGDVEPEEKDYVEQMRNTYNTYKKKNKLDEYFDAAKNSNLFIQLKKYIIPIEDPKKTVERKTGNILKGRSDLKKKGDKYTVDTELKIKKGLTPKEKKALKKSIVEELDNKIKGSGMRPTIVLSSDSEDERPKRGGRVKPIKTLKDVLKHLLEHIEDLDGEFDEDDYKQSKEIIDILKKVKKAKKRAIPVQSSLSQYLENVEKKKDDERLLKVDKFLNMF